MTVPPNASTPGPGWYPDPAGSGRLRWWDGTAWTVHFSAPPSYPGPPVTRPQLRENTPVYNPFIWLIVALPLVPLILLLTWNPVLRLRTIGAGRAQTVDPASLFSPQYFLLVISGFVIYGVSAFMAYLDWERLRRDGVVRPFHWAWVFLSREVYVIGRSVIVHQVAPKRGLAPVWVTIGVTLLALVLAGLKMSALVATIVNHAATI